MVGKYIFVKVPIISVLTNLLSGNSEFKKSCTAISPSPDCMFKNNWNKCQEKQQQQTSHRCGSGTADQEQNQLGQTTIKASREAKVHNLVIWKALQQEIISPPPPLKFAMFPPLQIQLVWITHKKNTKQKTPN